MKELLEKTQPYQPYISVSENGAVAYVSFEIRDPNFSGAPTGRMLRVERGTSLTEACRQYKKDDPLILPTLREAVTNYRTENNLYPHIAMTLYTLVDSIDQAFKND